jgi:hypothetical protein
MYPRPSFLGFVEADRAVWSSASSAGRLHASGLAGRLLPGDRTRLVVSGYAAARPRSLQAIQDFVFWEPAHWIMQTRQFADLKRRAERSPDVASVERSSSPLISSTA